MKTIDLLEKRQQLLRDLETVSREIEEAETSQYRMDGIAKDLIARFSSGQYVMVSLGRHWWVDGNGDLIELVSQDESAALFDLVKKGVISYFRHP